MHSPQGCACTGKLHVCEAKTTNRWPWEALVPSILCRAPVPPHNLTSQETLYAPHRTTWQPSAKTSSPFPWSVETW